MSGCDAEHRLAVVMVRARQSILVTKAPSEDECFNSRLDLQYRSYFTLKICRVRVIFRRLFDQLIRECLAMARLLAQRRSEWAAL